MLLLATFVSALLFISTFAENCTVQMIYDVLEPVASDPNFATCQTDSNYSLLSFESPSLNQTEEFCASSACQALLNTTLSSGFLPDCEVVIGAHSLNLTDAVAIASRCSESLEERAVSDDEGEDTLGRTADDIASVVGHSIPMDELVMALLRE
ncbi:hypothetical protein PC129_g4672 [Phytophthora cactorum]|uniref:Elicitin n=1 Tax=Phytophthora cactorum TaxID=29920 RepID=A0A329SWK7_9STRA|nr:hypothetical protein Pcac1_g24055 [Phytophthora cactorum]KAG2832918.1 hypothetical protein PC112_g6705 [Phytophthora cactorum]KAG2847001.1 hypothetical protein PC111_g964 [Phytophthora cactorum]KAG2861967.1 hypothetical protein PC113_g6717 [Phytophthora cactorum]KAG2929690.1 hypothetical protein PC115_g6758 [Phytophthora cactorum]